MSVWEVREVMVANRTDTGEGGTAVSRPSPDDIRRLERLLRLSGRAGLSALDASLAERGVDGAVELPAPDFEKLCVRLEEEARARGKRVP